MEPRAALVAEALSWIGTPYHTGGRLKGVGADCLTFLAGAFERVGLIAAPEIPPYPCDWHLHRSDEKYLAGVLAQCVEVLAPPLRQPLPGDIVLWRFGRCYSHGAIVVAWPAVVHAFIGRPIGREDAEASPLLARIGEAGPGLGKRRPRRVFVLKGWA